MKRDEEGNGEPGEDVMQEVERRRRRRSRVKMRDLCHRKSNTKVLSAGFILVRVGSVCDEVILARSFRGLMDFNRFIVLSVLISELVSHNTLRRVCDHQVVSQVTLLHTT